MKNGLVRKMLLFYLLIASSLFLCINTFYSRYAEEKAIKEKEQEIYAATVTVSNGYVQRYYSNRLTISKLMTELQPIANMLGVRFWITAPWGKVVGDTDPVPAGVDFQNIVDDAEAFLGETFHRDVYFYGAVSEPVLVVVVPITHQYNTKGYLCTLMPMEDIRQEAIEHVNTLNVYYVIVMLILAVVFFVGYCFMVLPLRKLIKAAKAYSTGDYDVKFKIITGGEYKELGDIIVFMGDTMYRFNEYQRDIIANISHDFRSPLTSIKGYAEAIKDGTIPREEQEKYLDVITFEAERLTKLTSNLLMLNTMDKKGIILQPVDFNVNELIKRLALTFEGLCKKKHLVIKLQFSSQNIIVQADKDKIEQVIYNLVDNAIKFSRPFGEIAICVDERGHKALLSVKDTGVGIPKDDVAKIWDRFYKSDSSRGKDKKGTGLGLSIVKEIIEAHNENISVISTERVGTEFLFTLPLSK